MDLTEPTHLSDEQLIHLMKQNNMPKLFDILYNRYYSKVTGKCYDMLKNKELAKESAIDILSKAYEKLPAFKEQSSFSSWLYTITYNHCIDYLRQRKRMHYPEWNRENEIPEIIDEQEVDLVDVNYEKLMGIMEIIHPEEKAMILMKYQDGLSIKDISKALRITDSACKMRLKRAKTRILFLYKKKYKSYNDGVD
ncbi:MAG: RNA polymerase sigma factor [Cyclobacteriaceae bacterium]|nr:RNA polymerase sigma factor [Cyclobacteriaceae bacterium]